MKKAALTFGLFSLIMVATSFATPEKTNKSIAGNIDISIGVDGGQGTNRKKSDNIYDTSNNKNSAGTTLNNLTLDSQFTKSRVKVD